jgi:TPR repeat protein
MNERNAELGVEPDDLLWANGEESFARGDSGRALQIYLKLAHRGHWLAYAEVGNLLELGAGGTTAQPDRALYWYRKAVFEADDPNAHFALARLHFHGQYVEQSFAKALSHCEKALRAPPPHQVALHYRGMAYVMLGVLYAKGLGTKRDVEKACQVLTEGAAEGFVWAKFELAALELRRWHLFRWFRMRMHAAISASELVSKDPRDPKLIGVRLPVIASRWEQRSTASSTQ